MKRFKLVDLFYYNVLDLVVKREKACQFSYVLIWIAAVSFLIIDLASDKQRKQISVGDIWERCSTLLFCHSILLDLIMKITQQILIFLTLSLPVPCWEGDITDIYYRTSLKIGKNISKLVKVNIAVTGSFIKECLISFLKWYPDR